MARLTPGEADRAFARRLAMIVIAVAATVFVVRIADLLLLVFGALLVAILLSTLADALARATRLPRGAGVAGAAALFVAVIALIFWLFGAETAGQLDTLRATLPADWARIRAGLAADPIGRLLLGSGTSAAGGGWVSGVLLWLGRGAGEVLFNFLVLVIAGIFLAADPALYRRGLLLMVPPPYRAAAADAVADTGAALRLWLLTQLFSMLAMGAMITGGLWLAGVQSWGALGVLGGLSEFIPYVGPTVAMIPALVVAAAGHGSVWGTLATYAIVRVVQANIITPLVSARVVSVPPGLYIFAILAAGFALGTFGMFFSGALAVAGYTLVRRVWLADTLGETIPRPGED